MRTELLQHEIVVESMSGETLEVEVSALKRTGLDKLLEAIQLQAELLDLKANPNRSAEGVIIEAKLERGRGPVGTVLVQRGTLQVGDIVVAGTAWGRVRALIDDRGETVAEAGPSVPVEILGFDSAPEAGDPFAVVENEGRAREITDYRVRKRRQTLGSAGTARTLEQMMQQLKEAGRKEFPLLVKGDVQGSVEAIVGRAAQARHRRGGGAHRALRRRRHHRVGRRAGGSLQGRGDGLQRARQRAGQGGGGPDGRRDPLLQHHLRSGGRRESGDVGPAGADGARDLPRQCARSSRCSTSPRSARSPAAGSPKARCERGAKVRLIRDNVVIHEGTLSTLKRFKDEVREVPAGQECGMAFANYQDMRVGDVIECFNVETIARFL